METPETRYAQREGLHLGYQVWGEGDTDILEFGSGTFISIDEAGEQPGWRRYTERLAACGRLIRFDPSGIGLSDSPADLDDLTFDAWVGDALAVMDAVGSTQAVVLGAAGSALPALLFAAEHPDRAESLVVVNASARYLEAEDYPIGIPVSLMDEFRAGLDPDHPDEGSEDLDDIRLFAPSGADDPEFRRWWSRAAKRGAAPAAAAVLNRITVEADYRPLLPRIATPTLVLHRHDALAPDPAHGRFIADHIAGARFIELPGGRCRPVRGRYGRAGGRDPGVRDRGPLPAGCGPHARHHPVHRHRRSPPPPRHRWAIDVGPRCSPTTMCSSGANSGASVGGW